MSHPFKSYEVKVLKVLLAAYFPERPLLQMLDEASMPRVQYTHYGFYVSVEHPAIGKARRVYNEPPLQGDLGQHAAGFVVFLENDTLTLETFPWNGEALPATFRESDVQLHGVPPEKDDEGGSSR